jgi:hypothetical protein
MFKTLTLQVLRSCSREAKVDRSFNTVLRRHASAFRASARPNVHIQPSLHRFYTGSAPGAQSAFGPSYAALLAIVSGMLGYGFARATIASDGKQEHTKAVSYGSTGEIAFAERELRAALPSENAVSTDKAELSLYGSSDNS